MSSSTHQEPHPLPATVNLGPEEFEFLKKQTKIDDEDKLKEHILTIQREAYAVGDQQFVSSWLLTWIG